jgi:hypothetical protein
MVLSTYHAVKRQLIGRFGQEAFNTHKLEVSHYLRRVSQFAASQAHSGIDRLLQTTEGLAELVRLVSVDDILSLSLACRSVHRLLQAETVYVRV